MNLNNPNNPFETERMDPLYTKPDDIGKGEPLDPDQMYNDQFKQPVVNPPAKQVTNESCKKECNEDCDKKYEKKGFFDFLNFFSGPNTTNVNKQEKTDEKKELFSGGKKRKSKSKSRK